MQPPVRHSLTWPHAVPLNAPVASDTLRVVIADDAPAVRAHLLDRLAQIKRVEVVGARPRINWTGPSLGNSDFATFELRGAPANGFASLWAARITLFTPNTVASTSLGGDYALALRGPDTSFIRRFAIQPIDANGEADFSYFQEAAAEGGFFGQWVVFDENRNPLTTTDAAINRSLF